MSTRKIPQRRDDAGGCAVLGLHYYIVRNSHFLGIHLTNPLQELVKELRRFWRIFACELHVLREIKPVLVLSNKAQRRALVFAAAVV